MLTADQKKQVADWSKGAGGFRPAGRPGQIMADSEQSRLKLTDDQRKDLASLQKIVDEQFNKVLTEAQSHQIKSIFSPTPPPPGPVPTNPGNPAHPGKIFSAAQLETLKLSPEQKKRLEEIQKEIDTRLATLLTEQQQQQLRVMQFSPPAGAGGPNRAPPGGAPLFRAVRYPIDYPGFAGRKMVPGKTVEELQPKEPEKKAPPAKK